MQTIQIETPEWALPLVERPARYRCAFGGRGGSKSWFFADLLVDRCMDSGISAVCIREVQRTLSQSVKRLLENRIQHFGLGQYFTIQRDQIKTPTGGLIIFQGMNNHTAESIKSLEGYDIAWVEEAQTFSQRSLDLLRPTIRKPNSELWFSWNPRFEDDPVDLLFRNSIPPDDSIIVNVNYDQNPWFPDVLKTEAEYDKRRDPDKYAHIWLGDYQKNSEARVFHNWQVDEFETPADAIFRFGADWGFSVDPTVLVRCFLIGRKLYIDYEAYQIGCEIMDTPDLFMTVPEAEKWPICCDSARPETISHMRSHGFPKVYGATKGKGSLYEGVEFLKSYDIYVHPRCKHTIDELSMYSYKVDEHTEKILPILEDESNHVIDSIRYALEGIRRHEKQKKNENRRKKVEVRPTANKW